MNNQFLEKKSTSAKVALIRCNSYEQSVVDEAVARGIGLLGGAGCFARAGEKILFKPNVLWATDPAKCVITHPSILHAAGAAFASTGAALQYGDSPAGILSSLPTLKKCGYDEALAGLKVVPVSFDNGMEREFSQGISSKRLQIAQAVVDADGVINLPKLKTHGLTRMTGAVKNLFGCVPGLTKGNYHTRFCDVVDFAQLLADIAAFVRPRLHLLDAIEAMEGNGPQSGTPKKLGVLLVSTDPVALDTIACRIIHLDPDFVPTIAAGVKAGLGTGDMQQIELLGDELEPVVDRTFVAVRMPPARVPANGIVRGIRRFFLPRPVISRTKCTKCGRCVSACPLEPKPHDAEKKLLHCGIRYCNLISIFAKNAAKSDTVSKALRQPSAKVCPTYDYRICIRCYCCQEVCPCSAITIRDPLLRRLFPIIPFVSLLVTRAATRRQLKKG
jgi:uncharacterized protein (DUF362 family)/ferredoxin